MPGACWGCMTPWGSWFSPPTLSEPDMDHTLPYHPTVISRDFWVRDDLSISNAKGTESLIGSLERNKIMKKMIFHIKK